MIIRSPAIVERAIALTGLGRITVESVIERLKVVQPSESAKVLELSFQADTSGEAMEVMKAIVASYDRFLKDNYQKDTREVISLIGKARDDLSKELKQLEQEYLEFRQKSPFLLGRQGRADVSGPPGRPMGSSKPTRRSVACACSSRPSSNWPRNCQRRRVGAYQFITGAINQLSGGGGGSGVSRVASEETHQRSRRGGSHPTNGSWPSLPTSSFQTTHRGTDDPADQGGIRGRRGAPIAPDDPEVIRDFFAMSRSRAAPE